MANARIPGPERDGGYPVRIDDGTLCRQPSPSPGPVRGDLGPLSIVSGMSLGEKLTEATWRAGRYLGPEFSEKFLALMTPQAIAIMGSAVTLWAAGHFFGISEVIDVVFLGLGAFMVGSEAIAAGQELTRFATGSLNAKSYSDLDEAAQHFARFVSIVGIDTAVALLLHTATGEAAGSDSSLRGNIAPRYVNLTPTLRISLRPDISLSGAGRSGENVKFLTGPPNSAVKSVAEGRIFITNSAGQVIFDITEERVKQVLPQVGFVGEKRQSLTDSELDLIKQLWK